MIVASADSFAQVRRALRLKMMGAPPVKTERWQGVAANTDTHELQNVVFEVDLRGVEDLDHWRADAAPNLPWADDHFEKERVGGKCLNPGNEWKNWPWSRSAANFRGKQELGPRMPPQDWAYLAGLIDGEGTVDPRMNLLPTFQGRISVGQKEREVLDWIVNTFKVGKVSKMPSRTITLHGKDYEHDCHMWNLSGSANVRWIITNCMPYLIVKKKKAEEMIEALNIGDKKQESPMSHRQTVWGMDWPSRFNHSYADRLWPKRLEGGTEFRGQHWTYGDLNDLVQLLAKEPHTRQGWIPLFHPDDTGFGDGGRKMCSLGYQLMVREGRLHMWYPLRSCDLRRHWADDCYLAVRLMLWVLDRCRENEREKWLGVVPGTYAMHMTSLHIFSNDYKELVENKW